LDVWAHVRLGSAVSSKRPQRQANHVRMDDLSVTKKQGHHGFRQKVIQGLSSRV